MKTIALYQPWNLCFDPAGDSAIKAVSPPSSPSQKRRKKRRGK